MTSNLNNVDINDASGRFSPRMKHLVHKISNLVVTIPCFFIVLLQGKLDLLEHPILFIVIVFVIVIVIVLLQGKLDLLEHSILFIVIVFVIVIVIVILQGKLDLLEHPIFELFILLKWARVHFLFKVWFT